MGGSASSVALSVLHRLAKVPDAIVFLAVGVNGRRYHLQFGYYSSRGYSRRSGEDGRRQDEVMWRRLW